MTRRQELIRSLEEVREKLELYIHLGDDAIECGEPDISETWYGKAEIESEKSETIIKQLEIL